LSLRLIERAERRQVGSVQATGASPPEDAPASLPARSYGSTTQLAARLASTYAPMTEHVASHAGHAGVAPSASTEALSRAVGAQLYARPSYVDANLRMLPGAGPLDLARALGLSVLLVEAQRESARRRRRRLRRRSRSLQGVLAGARTHQVER
jgi:hypothetical protein